MQIAVDAPTPSWEDFEFALECADPELRAYYDTVTGEVHITGPFEDEPGERERIDADPRRYREIDRLGSRETHEWMECFVEEEVGDERLQAELGRALVGRGCFRRFKDVLLSAPVERAAWFCYRDRLIKRAIERWFDDHDLPVGSPPPWWVGRAA